MEIDGINGDAGDERGVAGFARRRVQLSAAPLRPPKINRKTAANSCLYISLSLSHRVLFDFFFRSPFFVVVVVVVVVAVASFSCPVGRCGAGVVDSKRNGGGAGGGGGRIRLISSAFR